MTGCCRPRCDGSSRKVKEERDLLNAVRTELPQSRVAAAEAQANETLRSRARGEGNTRMVFTDRTF